MFTVGGGGNYLGLAIRKPAVQLCSQPDIHDASAAWLQQQLLQHLRPPSLSKGSLSQPLGHVPPGVCPQPLYLSCTMLGDACSRSPQACPTALAAPAETALLPTLTASRLTTGLSVTRLP